MKQFRAKILTCKRYK